MASSSKEAAEGQVYSGRLGIRHLQMLVVFLGVTFSILLRANLSIAIVAMVDTKDPAPLAETYDWDEAIQGYILSSFFWGYLVTQIPSGLLTERFGANRFLYSSVLGSSLLTLVFPQCAYYGGWMMVCANRTLQGLCQGFGTPSAIALLGVWVPPNERSRLATMAMSGGLLGAVISSPISGLISSAYGWPYVFHILGAVGVGISIVMALLGSDYPSTHRLISLEEREYIEMSLGGAKKKAMVPWKNVAKCVPYHASACSFVFKNAVYTAMVTKIPTFVSTVLKYDLTESGFISAIPFLTSWLLSFVFSWICDALIQRDCLSITAARKIFNSISSFGAAAFVILLGYSDDRTVSIVFLTLTLGSTAAAYSGVPASFVDMAPNFSGAIFSVVNVLSAFVGLCGPIIIGYIVTESGSAEQWRIVFFLFAALWVFSNIVYVLWGSSETQWWNWPERYKDENDYKQRKANEDGNKKSAC